MSQEKAQLIAPIENITVAGVVATGVITATSFDGNVTGSASSIVQGENVVAGVVTSTSLIGNLTGNAGGLSGDPDIHVGVLTATSFVGNVTGIVTGRATGLSNTGAGTSNLNIGTLTATTFYGDGSGLSGVAGAAFSQQSIGITSATTTIDLSNGNVVNANQSANTTVSFANTAGSNEVYIFRDKDATDTTRTITWPASIKWDGGTEPTLSNVGAATTEGQIFKLCTITNGETWYGKEVYKDSGAYALFATGYNIYGELGLNDSGTPAYRSSPTQVGTENGWNRLLRAQSWTQASFGIKDDGQLWATGGVSAMGQLGLNQPSNTRYSSPVQIGTDTNWSMGTGSRTGTFALKTNNTLWSWGYDGAGQLGQNTHQINRSSPTQITGETWSTIGNADRAIFATKTDNTMWTWGNNYKGLLGVNIGSASLDTSKSSPTELPGGNWAYGCGNGYTAYASKTDNTLWSWGYHQYGKLGLNDAITRSSPTQISGTNWGNTQDTMAQGNDNSMANIKTDGTLWSWGYGGHGTLGTNDREHRSSPIQVGTDTNWSTIGFSGDSAFATKTDGTAWTWGSGGYGQQGHNDQISRSSPTQLPGFWRGDCGGNAYGALHLRSR